MLSNLHTLIISTTKNSLIVDNDIWKLYQLRHFRTNTSAKLHAPPASDSVIGKENMKTLSSIDPESCTEEIFTRTQKIKKLGVRGKLSKLLEDGSSKPIQNLGKIHELRNLKIFNEVTTNSQVSSLSISFTKMLKKMAKLTLSGTSLGWKHMSILGKLESLEVLKLKDLAFKGDKWESSCGYLPSLIFLCILRTYLKNWGASVEQFPSLKHLALKNCDEILGVPSCVEHVKSLQMLDIYCCSKEAIKCAREVHAEKVPGSLMPTIYSPDM